jgi:predicted secreted hydrolase
LRSFAAKRSHLPPTSLSQLPSRAAIVSLVILALLVQSCAINRYPLRKTDLAARASAVEDWAPHDGLLEWWYLTGRVTDTAGTPYFFQQTIFHGAARGLEIFMLHLSAVDLKHGVHRFVERQHVPSRAVYAGPRAAVFKDSRLELRTEDGRPVAVAAIGVSQPVRLNLVARLNKPVTWHGRNGVIPMGHPDAQAQRSFYYSFTGMDVKGTLAIDGREVAVTGEGWLDRQWGHFSELGWEWFSLRLDDGREIMLFAFPRTGYRIGTAIARDGSTRPIDSFGYANVGSMTFKSRKVRVSLGWTLEVGDESFRVTPILSAGQMNDAWIGPSYWEGLCEVRDSSGKRLGHAVVETTLAAQRTLAAGLAK